MNLATENAMSSTGLVGTAPPNSVYLGLNKTKAKIQNYS